MSNSQAWVFTGLCDFVSRGFTDNNENDMTVLTITINANDSDNDNYNDNDNYCSFKIFPQF